MFDSSGDPPLLDHWQKLPFNTFIVPIIIKMYSFCAKKNIIRCGIFSRCIFYLSVTNCANAFKVSHSIKKLTENMINGNGY